MPRELPCQTLGGAVAGTEEASCGGSEGGGVAAGRKGGAVGGAERLGQGGGEVGFFLI